MVSPTARTVFGTGYGAKLVVTQHDICERDIATVSDNIRPGHCVAHQNHRASTQVGIVAIGVLGHFDVWLCWRQEDHIVFHFTITGSAAGLSRIAIRA